MTDVSLTPQPVLPRGAGATPRWRRHPAQVAAVAAFVVIAAAGELEAKWWPYSHRLVSVLRSGVYPGTSILAKAGRAGSAPSWHDAWHFTVAYGEDVWIALLAGLLIGAGVEALLPRSWLQQERWGTGWRASLAGGLAALPCMMCTCCGAPITRSLRRSGTPVAGALSYWIGNPLLNPAVLAFLAVVLPWRYVLVRAVVGALLVFGVAPLVARLAPGRRANGTVGEQAGAAGPVDLPASGTPQASVPVRYFQALLRMAVVLVPEYLVVVVLVGALAGWLFPLGHATLSWGAAAALVAAAAGTLLVIPTAAEIPVMIGLLALGFSPLVVGAVMIALPAVSLPSMVMVGRWLSWRVVAATAGSVMLAALLAGALVSAL